MPSVRSVVRLVAKGPRNLAPLTINAASFRRALLAWYDANRRDLPWRRTTDPYSIWLSEIMLQQTRVAAVLDHYRIFLDRFPNISSLAAASEDSVLAAWSGLGYYRRARMLHQCAREIVDQHSGSFPQTAESLYALPGIGRYTAAAIASIAFHQPIAVVDGNVERILQRLTGQRLTGQRLTGQRLAGRRLTSSQCWQRAQQLLALSRPGDFNQALMELGATVCVPREPRCLICPVRKWCATRGELSPSKPTAPRHRREIWYSLQRRTGCVRLLRRPQTASLMAGMWELPHWSELPHPSAHRAVWRTFRHSITVTDYNVHVLQNWPPSSRRQNGNAPAATKPVARGRWIAFAEIKTLPLTGLTRKILKAAGIIE